MTDKDGLYIALISLHGLIRGEEPELGRDADTGGQVLYVLDLARALAEHPDVSRVELMTRQILSTNVDYQYGEPLEQIADRAWIRRLPFGPHRYLYKENLWPYLSQFVDNALVHFREIGRVPDVIHSHYADAGDAGVRLARLISAPLVHTGHSLGRVKKQRLLEKGLSQDVIEERYNMSRRIEGETRVLDRADLIIASTQQEIDEQYGMYPAVARSRMAVIPPGVDLGRFRPPRRGEVFKVARVIDRFLERPRKPMILAVQRPDERKNLETLIRAYGESDSLREFANLVLLVGTRDDIDTVPKGQRRVLQQMLRLIDRYDLYGSVAYPKQHSSEDIAEIYRLAASRRGVFVNPALTEPFGLTLIEAAASGLPIVAPNDG
ncbi:MAG: glycosyltransferase, partial [Thermoanaerobaculales bacterium]|nr:glycosyltransferase [Thermoanaerobaculales bacterium]